DRRHSPRQRLPDRPPRPRRLRRRLQLERRGRAPPSRRGAGRRPGQPAAGSLGRRLLRPRRHRADPRPGPRRRSLVRRRRHHHRLRRPTERRRPGLRRRLRPGGGRDPAPDRGRLPRQRPDHGPGRATVPDRKRRRDGGRVRHLRREVPRGVRRRRARGAGGRDAGDPASGRSSLLFRADDRRRLEDAAVLGGGCLRGLRRRQRRGALHGPAGQGRRHRGRRLARDHGLPAPGRVRPDHEGARLVGV
ncbi:MAG: Probable signal peptide protein, partial [uncultured Thermomicrobiales bacterium]